MNNADNMREHYETMLSDLGLMPADGKLRALCLAALERDVMSLADCQAIRDLVSLFGPYACNNQGALWVMLAGLMMARHEGSPCLRFDPESDPAERLNRRLRFSGDQAGWVNGQWEFIRRSLAGGDWDALVHVMEKEGQEAARPIVAVRRGERQFLYFQRYYRHDHGLAGCLRGLIARKTSELPPDQIRGLVENASGYEGFALTEQQRVALYLALRRTFAIISGGPGTGKTTLVCSILRALLAQGLDAARIFLAAPTGRAGQRMGESLRSAMARATGAAQEHVGIISGMTGSTIHRLLKYDPSRDEYVYNEQNRLPADALIVDEVSMVDMVMMHRLLIALPETCRVVFLGDKDQLPSVEAGTVLGDLVPRECEPVYSPETAEELTTALGLSGALNVSPNPPPLADRIALLTVSHRNHGELHEIAQRINAGDAAMELPALPVGDKALAGDLNRGIEGDDGIDWTEPKHSCRRLGGGGMDAGSAEHVRRLALSWTRFFYGRPGRSGFNLRELVGREFPVDALMEGAASEQARNDAVSCAKELFARLADFRILTLLRKGPFGVSGINRFLAGQWRPELDGRAPSRMELFAGAPIIVTRNTPARELFNGDLGVMVRAGGRRYFGLFQRGERYIACPAEHLPEHEPAFAITVHKSQGSQYGNVLLVLPPDEENLLLVRETLYTGITRAENSAFIFGSGAAIKAAISRRMMRQSGVDYWGGL